MSKLHLVFGGRVKDPQGLEFVDLKGIDLVGLYDSYAEAEDAWRTVSEENRHKAGVRFSIVEEPSRISA